MRGRVLVVHAGRPAVDGATTPAAAVTIQAWSLRPGAAWVTFLDEHLGRGRAEGAVTGPSPPR